MNAVELLMNVTPNETRIALVEMGVLKKYILNAKQSVEL
ncbi:ribonuclease G [Rodentibacter pneumotropicus]|uniref:Ribonuclease G n=1 Tax=Rodentibacter pneumotropicus TaxID=758 RepID=A0A448MSD2_9PAST|nr:ribonuclease G [Rodentibacter pneumotropicus]